MSSVAVLTQESFIEHRSGLLPEQSGGECLTIYVLLSLYVLVIRVVSSSPPAAGGPNAGEEEEELPTYKDAFPPLPEKAATPEGTQETSNAWTSKIRPLKSSIITQVNQYYYLNLSCGPVSSFAQIYNNFTVSLHPV